ncbi:MAG: HAMP domain-containing sensor histidine kinase, partial [Salinivenus sp.]
GSPALPVGSTGERTQEARSPQAEVRTESLWHRSPWALGAVGVGAAGLMVLLVRWRTKALERRRKELEETVAERTREGQRRKRQLEVYNRELLRTNEALRKTIEEKSRLLGVAAHDLKNPLFGIRALSEILLETGGLPEKGERKLTLIRDSADDTLRLIEDLLATAATSERTERAHQAVDLAALAQWVVRSFDPQADWKDQVLSCDVQTDAPCVVEGDKRKLREAVANLVSNALKYSPPGAEVEVHVDRRDDQVQVAVVDSGPGLSETDQQRLFAPFQRLSAEPTGGEGSSGLGLYIVKQIIDMHEGSVDVVTELGEGSTFTLLLPAITPTSAPVPETDPAALGRQD